MKTIRKFGKEEEAVSPVIGVILMVAITVILAAVIAAFVFGMGGGLSESPPTVSFTAANNPASAADDIIIRHTGGETLLGSEWKISVVPSGANPVYVTSDSGSGTDFEVGGQLVIETETTGDTASFNATLSSPNWVYSSGGTVITDGQKYDVKMVHVPSSAMVLDTVVEVR